ncbi:MAG: hypothetical protein IKB82_07350 [Clostridia bacterium]|nr:hypothetical protein [Clostridia bacterium]
MIRLLRRCHIPLLALAGFTQLLTLTLCRHIPGAAMRLSLFPALCALMLLVCAAVPGRVRPMLFGACVITLVIAARLLLPAGAASIVMPAGCAALVLYALSLAGKNPAQVTPMFYFACVLAQAVSLFLLYQADHVPLLIRGAFYLWLLLFLLAFNRISLNNATLARYNLSAGMARTGTVLTLCLFVLALLLCAMPAVVSGIIHLFTALRDGSLWLLLAIAHLFPAESVGGSMGSAMPMLPEGIASASQPSHFAMALEKIAAVLSVIILIMGCAALLRLLLLALIRLARGVLAHLARYAVTVSADYEDEITDTRTEGGEYTFLHLHRSAKPKQTYPDTPAGRIRSRYAQLIARHSEWTPSSTARENLPENAAALYEQARYSDHAPSAEDAQRFDRETR